MTTIMWFRRDLRLADNPAWAAAAVTGDELLPVFCLDTELFDLAGSHRRAWVLGSLQALDRSLAELGGRLHVVAGDPAEILPALAGDHGVVHWNADYTPRAAGRDVRVIGALGSRSNLHHGGVVHPPGAVEKQDGTSYRVFTPYWNRWRTLDWDTWDIAAPATVTDDPGSGLPVMDDAPSIEPGEKAAMRRLRAFRDRVGRYPEERDRPEVDATSRLSADLKIGSLDPRRIRAMIGEATRGGEALVRQLCWRDFYVELMANDPESTSRAWNPKYRDVEWVRDQDGFSAWKDGATGYPIVDAGMRELAATGFMHNRVRMIAASFLVKDLQIDWRMGERHFRQMLVDADVASNVGNWQWVAGTGADAAPYFRVFNPVVQGERFDPDGGYVRRWIPELAAVPARWIHRPWEAPPLDLASWGVSLGREYPLPIVDHAEARRETLERYRRGIG